VKPGKRSSIVPKRVIKPFTFGPLLSSAWCIYIWLLCFEWKIILVIETEIYVTYHKRKWQILLMLNHLTSCIGGVVVSVLATGPKGCVFKTRPRRWIFKGDKNPQHTFLSDGK
jgi:hypothetical protein